MRPSISLEAVHEAHQRIKDLVHRTPLMTSRSFNTLTSADIVFKCENLQRAGVFKARGAFNAVYSLSAADAIRGVVTSSSGNQAAALALAANSRGIPAYIAMPKNALKSKIAAVRRYGGNIVWVESQGAIPTSEEYEATAARVLWMLDSAGDLVAHLACGPSGRRDASLAQSNWLQWLAALDVIGKCATNLRHESALIL